MVLGTHLVPRTSLLGAGVDQGQGYKTPFLHRLLPSSSSHHQMLSWLSALSLATTFAQHALAAPGQLVTVIVPVLDPDSTLTAVVLGVDSKGHTTYQLDQPEVGLQSGGTRTTTSIIKPATATLVAGSDYASYTYSVDDPGRVNIHLGFDCIIEGGGGDAICSNVNLNVNQNSVAAATTTFLPDALAKVVLDIVPNSPAPSNTAGGSQAGGGGGPSQTSSVGGKSGASTGPSLSGQPSPTGSQPSAGKIWRPSRLLWAVWAGLFAVIGLL
ncbi:hypothetical protein MIND_01099300 [Mycena indigotica]|uniref:Uncharacterized protein n=1 Tax=Mycena indigotica TaxID=2126181 RepID=A0A8H6VVN4_9AGAR|nr:uncharacterized protein MIND_01099300 [Mycena indigotica]KAF7295592.1 hypothetical protein MIND_01099300 [Mycena indigotica]